MTHEQLRAAYDAVVYAIGARVDRPLDIPGIDLPGSHSATAFVGWYNGHPDHSQTEWDLGCERAVVIGNGNVAADVTRLLSLGPAELEPTDVAPRALAALSESRVREVVVLGRRGPAQAAFTNAELAELGTLPGVDVHVDASEVELDELSREWLEAEGHLHSSVQCGDAARVRGQGADWCSAADCLSLWGLARGAARDCGRRSQVAGIDDLPQRAVPRRGRLAALARDGGRRDDSVRAGAALDRLPRRPAARRAVRRARLDDPARARARGRRARPASPFPASTRSDGSSAGRRASSERTNAMPPRRWRRCSQTPTRAGFHRPRTPARWSACSTGRVVDWDGWRAIDRRERAAGEAAGRPRVKLDTVGELLGAARDIGSGHAVR